MFIKLANLARSTYWKMFKPQTKGVKCLVQNKKEVLLLLNSYGSKKWNLPGGGVKRKERPEEAIKRELNEEVGIRVESLRPIGRYTSNGEGKRDEVFCYSYVMPTKPKLSLSKEVRTAEWHRLDHLPVNLSRSVRSALELLGGKD